MKRIHLLILIAIISFQIFAVASCFSAFPKDNLTKVLILSGKNNHEWQKTTPILLRIFKESTLFTVSVTEKPDTLTFASMKGYSLILSNWNSWPDNRMRMSLQWEDNFMKYVIEGGGVLSIHAGASSFYDWPAYHKIGIGRWGKETSHGPRTKGHVYGFDQNHPVTKGLAPFYIMDEIWERTDIDAGATAIGSLTATDEKDGHPIDVKAVFVNQTGGGRCFFTTLGHDERALLNSGLQTLLLRAAQWCSRNKVTVEVPSDLKTMSEKMKDQFAWNKTDTSLALNNHSEVVWQFNYSNRFGKPYFHPLTVNHSVLTCVSPPDHPWHLGLWFSWKFINGVNYWEYLRNFNSPETGFKSEGITEITRKKITSNSDFSSDIVMELLYHPIDDQAVLKEERRLHISKPVADGSYYMDEEHLFRALADSVILDRTPVSGEPGGQSWGGYAGLSVRFSQDYTAPVIMIDSTKLRKGFWLYMGFNTLTGEKAGISILQHPKFTTVSSSWYMITDTNIPFYYFSPAVLFDHNIVLRKGQTLLLKYRIWMLPGTVSKEEMQGKYIQYLNNNL